MNDPKEVAAQAALAFVQPGMKLGVGTGSTVAFFIEKLAEKYRDGLEIKTFPTSKKSEDLLKKYQIPLLPPDTAELDLAVDGADEIDMERRMIKGGGGALFREKIVAAMSKMMIVIVDERKNVQKLGSFPLPVELCTFAYQATIRHINNLGLYGSLRKKEGELYLTDSKNYIYDIDIKNREEAPEELDRQLSKIPGVVETGIFIGLASKVIVGYSNGNVEIR